jgi:hypothetical protein
MEYVKIKDSPSLIRDLHSKAILETNMNAVQRYEQQRKLFDERNNQKEEIINLKEEVSEIKQMLKIIIDSLKN